MLCGRGDYVSNPQRSFLPHPKKNTSSKKPRGVDIPASEKITGRKVNNSSESTTSHSILTPLEFTSGRPYLLENEELNKFFKIKTLKILKSIYPKSCNCNNPNLLFLKVKNRDSIARCSNCHKMVSITAKTPFENYRSNLAYISFIIWDMINQYPKIMTSKEISRKLNLSYKTSFYLKKRIQVIFSQLNETLRETFIKS
ncbi:hypothetical protein LEP1GSC199_0107 [Leptospira vanthielii serovar Holland str. Waz Holland = ATCC 700522]|uniref:Transposase zinc-ribbon domain protein n=1 Tax=Leptospira vanthielii serovar Holland str. Waz Holland = ATCC 700522 TaxID=1218591 RepID=N1WJ22_9LEPT|nr:hypothetical protein LEP1GSC199_0107 [Leptospira vanthielii serovar Holland str. Waz Holland = ATCC 700522]